MKKVIFDTNSDIVYSSNTSPEKIYAFLSNECKIYILKGINDRFSWVNFTCVDGAWNGCFGSLNAAMDSVSSMKVFEFNYSEFVGWLKVNL